MSRSRTLNSAQVNSGPVLYWMDRERRVQDNWALLRAQEIALQNKQPLAVVYALPANFIESTRRHYDFMLRGLEEVEADLAKKNIAFHLLAGDPAKTLPKFLKEHGITQLITDYSPLKLPRSWREELTQSCQKQGIHFEEVDARNIVPVWEASDKLEYAAYTIRPKIHKNLKDYLTEIPALKKHAHDWPSKAPKTDWERVHKTIKVNEKSAAITWLKPGEKAAHAVLKDFLENKLSDYAELRNDPNQDVLSNLSPYLHYGMISAQRIALQAIGHESFFEELVVRRELSDNFCHYNPNYDNFNGFHEWAQKTLNEHRDDPREYLYSLAEFEAAKTHDPLWNAAQNQMLQTGKMHGYMRMYWAKKILEWSASPEEALHIAITLNDRYELDGRDPNGYVGCAWSIGGVHDRAWTERPVFGKIRYMNYNGCKRKFDIHSYINKYGTESESTRQSGGSQGTLLDY